MKDELNELIDTIQENDLELGFNDNDDGLVFDDDID